MDTPNRDQRANSNERTSFHLQAFEDEDTVKENERLALTICDTSIHNREISRDPPRHWVSSIRDSVMEGCIDTASSFSITNHTDTLLSRTEYQLILQGIFVETTFPKGSGRFRGFEYMMRNAQHNKTLMMAMKTLQCVLVGEARKDPRLSHQATISYPQAMASLRAELCEGNIAPGHFLAVVHLFLKIELFQATSTQGGGWQQHIAGSKLAVDRSRWSDDDPAIPNLVQAVIHEFGLWDGLLKRRQGVCVLTRSCGTDPGDVWSRFVCTTTQVPAILEAADRICRLGHNAPSRGITEVVERIVAMEGDLHRSLRDSYGQINGLPYWISRDGTFGITLGYEEGDTYPRNIYSFSSFAMAQQHTTYWMCLLSLHQAHMDILGSVTRAQHSFKNHDLRARVKRDAGECADHLVMSLCYFLKSENGYFGLTKAIAPLQLAFIWYRRCEDEALMLYCRRVAERIQRFGLKCSWSEW